MGNGSFLLGVWRNSSASKEWSVSKGNGIWACIQRQKNKSKETLHGKIMMRSALVFFNLFFIIDVAKSSCVQKYRKKENEKRPVS